MSQPAVFVTGNTNKAKHMKALLGVDIEYTALDLDEIQSADAGQVVSKKAKQAYDLLGRPVFVDDFSLGFDELGGLPGPFIKFFVDAPDGLEKLCRMADGLDSRRATARGYIGYCDDHGVQVLYGELRGTIAEHPSESNDGAFGADPIFVLEEYGGRTRAQLTPDEYAEVYEVVRPISKLRKLLS